MFGPIGIWEMVIILVVALIVFGPRKLPELGRSLGKSLGEFKRASSELRSTLDQEIRIEDRQKPTPTAATTSATAATTSATAATTSATAATTSATAATTSATTAKPAAVPAAQPASATTAGTALSGGHSTKPDVGA